MDITSFILHLVFILVTFGAGIAVGIAYQDRLKEVYQRLILLISPPK